MKVLGYGKFIEAADSHSKQEMDIKALYCFLSAAMISDITELRELFPEAVNCEAGRWEIGFAYGKLLFTGTFDFDGQFILSECITKNSTKESEQSE